jgi:putative transposase
MKRKRHTPEQIIRKLRDAEAMAGAGKSSEEIARKLEIGESTLQRWRTQYGQMSGSELKHLKGLEEENRRLKKLVADQAIDIQILKEAAEGNW